MGNQCRSVNTKICVICGKQFADPPSSKRVCCSKECSKRRKTISHIGKSNPWPAEARKKRSMLGQTENLKKGTAAAMELPEGQRGPQNRCAKSWTLKSPDGIIYEVTNLLDWCRNNAGLFGKEPNDKNAKCISSGLLGVKRSMEGKRKPPVNSYMGWTILDWGPPNPE